MSAVASVSKSTSVGTSTGSSTWAAALPAEPLPAEPLPSLPVAEPVTGGGVAALSSFFLPHAASAATTNTSV